MYKKVVIVIFVILVILFITTFAMTTIFLEKIEPYLHHSFCEDKYHFFPNSSEDRRFSLEMKNDDGTAEVLLKNCNNSQIVGNKLFVFSDEEGYCILDLNSGKCRLFITLSNEEFISGWGVTEEGEKIFTTRKIASDLISYLNSYEEFSEEEQKVFEKMKLSK